MFSSESKGFQMLLIKEADGTVSHSPVNVNVLILVSINLSSNACCNVDVHIKCHRELINIPVHGENNAK